MLLTPEQHQKIELLDRLFGALSVEQLREFSETEEVIAILKNSNDNPEILKKLIQKNSTLSTDMDILKNDVMMLKSDVQTLIKVINKPYETYHITEFNSLKSRHCVY